MKYEYSYNYRYSMIYTPRLVGDVEFRSNTFEFNLNRWSIWYSFDGRLQMLKCTFRTLITPFKLYINLCYGTSPIKVYPSCSIV